MSTESLLQEILDALKAQQGSGGGSAPMPAPSEDLQALITQLRAGTDEQNKFADALERATTSLTAGTKAATEQLNILRRTKDIQDAVTKSLATSAIENQNALQTATAKEAALQSELANQQAILEAKVELGQLGPNELILEQGKLATLEAELSAQTAIVDATTEQGKKLEAAAKANSEILGDTEAILNKMMLSSTGYEDSFFGRAEALGEGDVLKGMSMAFSQIGKTVLQAVSPANLLANAFSNVVETTIRMVGMQDRALAGFNKVTAAGGQYDDVILQVRSDTFSFGTTIEEATEAVKTLVMEFSGFSALGAEAQARVAGLTAQFENLGVSARQTAQFFEEMTQGMRMSTTEAEGYLRQAATDAMNLGIPIGQFMDQLNAAMPQLAAYGKRATEVFTKVAAAAKAAGIETGRLLQVMGNTFDTFQGAGQAVAGLNAILGGPFLNSLQLVNATEDERIRLLLQSFEQSGKNFTQMSKFEQKAIAAKMGITDMALANKLFGMSVSEYDSYIDKTGQAAESQEEMAERAEKARSAQEKLTAVLQQLAIVVTPLVKLLHLLLKPFVYIIDKIGPEFSIILAVWIAFTWKFVAAKWAETAATSANIITKVKDIAITLAQVVGYTALLVIMIALTAAYIAYEAAIFVVKGTMAVLNVIAYLLSGGMIALGGATAFAALKFVLIAGAIALLIYLFTAPHSPPFYLLLPIIALGMWLMGKAAIFFGSALGGAAAGIMAGGIALLVLGAAIFLIGAAIALVVAAVALLVMAFTAFFETLAANFGDLILLAPALVLIGFAAPLAMLGLLLLAVGIIALGIALLFVKTEDLQALAAMFEGMGKAAEGGAGGMASITGFLSTLQSVADDIDFFSLLALSSMFESISKMGDVGPSVEPLNELVKNVSQLGDAVEPINQFAEALDKLATVLINFGAGVGILGLFGAGPVDMIKDLVQTLGEDAGKVQIEKLTAMQKFIESVQTMTAAQLSGVASSMEQLMGALEEISFFKALTLGFMFSNLSDISTSPTAVEALNSLTTYIKTVGQVDGAHVDNAEQLVDQAIRFATEANNLEAQSATNGFLEKLLNIFGSDSKKETGGKRQQTIVLTIDSAGREKIAQGIIDPLIPMINKKLDIRNRGGGTY